MLTVFWKGKAISENRRHVIRNGKISASREYEKFIDGLAWTIRAEAKGQRYKRLDIAIDSKVNAWVDHQNLCKPICDAVQRSGLIENDKMIGNIWMQEAKRHKKGELDEIWLYFTRMEN